MEGYLSLLNDLKAQTSDEATAILLLQEIAKDRRTESMNSRNQTGSGVATPKQLAFLKKLNVEHDSEISKSEASRLIDEAMQKD